MQLANLTLRQYTEQTAAPVAVPGGGPATALFGAVGAALAGMAGGLTAGRAQYRAHHSQARALATEAAQLRHQLLALAQQDSDAYNALLAAARLPAQPNGSARAEAMQQALRRCTETPLQTMELALATLQLMHRSIEGLNPNAAGDFGVGALGLAAAARGAWLNICANTGRLADEAFAQSCRASGQAALQEALPLAEDIYQKMLVVVSR